MLRHLRRGSAIGIDPNHGFDGSPRISRTGPRTFNSPLPTSRSHGSHGSHGSNSPTLQVQFPKATDHTDHTDPIPNGQLPAANGPNSKSQKLRITRITRIQFLTASCQLPAVQIPTRQSDGSHGSHGS